MSLTDTCKADDVNLRWCLFDEDSMQDPSKDDVVSFLRNTAVDNKRADFFDWCRICEAQYPHIAPLMRDSLDLPHLCAVRNVFPEQAT